MVPRPPLGPGSKPESFLRPCALAWGSGNDPLDFGLILQPQLAYGPSVLKMWSTLQQCGSHWAPGGNAAILNPNLLFEKIPRGFTCILRLEKPWARV